ncbi:MAG: conserved hypothetical rane protein [Thermoplasmatales archaeon]|nr:conserved hypothetical rane protein [Thermoplasmatales archaeon]
MRQQNSRGHLGITRVAGVCGMFLPVVIFTSLGLSIASSPWFTWTQHALSDLGIQENSAFLFNYGMIIGGFLALIFSFGLMKILANKLGAYVLALSSLALIGVGLFPETFFTLHFLTSASFFILLAFGLLIIGVTSGYNVFERTIGLLAMVLVLIALGSTVFLFHFDGIAVTEAFCCFPAFIWCSIVGLKMTFISG